MDKLLITMIVLRFVEENLETKFWGGKKCGSFEYIMTYLNYLYKINLLILKPKNFLTLLQQESSESWSSEFWSILEINIC